MENNEKKIEVPSTGNNEASLELNDIGKNEELAYKKERNKGIITLAIYIVSQTVIAIIISIIIQVVLGVVYPDVFKDFLSDDIYFKDQAEEFIMGKTNFYANILVSLTLFISLGILFFKEIKADIKKTFSSVFPYIFMIVCLGFVMTYIGNAIGSVITEAIFGKTDSNNQVALEEMIAVPSQMIPMGFMIIIFAPIYEELIFRKAIFSLFRNTKKGNIIAIFVSAFTFAAVHVASQGDFGMIIAYIIPALVFATAYHLTKRNIITTITIHMANNLLAFIAILLTTYLL